MRKHLIWRSGAATVLALAALPFGTAHLPSTRAASGQTVSVWMGEWQPNPVVSQTNPHPHKALLVLAQQFEKQTGIHINFVSTGFNISDTNAFTEYPTYMQTHVAANTAPDVMFVHNHQMDGSTGWFANLDPYLNAPNPFIPGNKHWIDVLTQQMMTSAEEMDTHGNHYFVALNGSLPGVLIGVLEN